jgi:hypothetical protein
MTSAELTGNHGHAMSGLRLLHAPFLVKTRRGNDFFLNENILNISCYVVSVLIGKHRIFLTAPIFVQVKMVINKIPRNILN